MINKLVLRYNKKHLRELESSRRHPIESQNLTFDKLIKGGQNTLFGQDHNFSQISNYQDFAKNIPVREYDQFEQYIDKIRAGEQDILWNRPTKWLAKSSGTSTGRSKFIPITVDNIKDCQYSGFLKVLNTYLTLNPRSRLFLGKSLTIGGSVNLDSTGSEHLLCGDLSAILLKNSPFFAELARIPSKKLGVIPDFNKKIELVCKHYSKSDVRSLSGVPAWNLIFLQKAAEYNNVKHITDIWPNLEVFMHGGIGFEPYRAQFNKLIPSDKMHYIENYNASEGYFALQDDFSDKSMLLTLNNGVFYEFIPLEHLDAVLRGESSEIYPIEGVVTNKVYAMVITTNSGLWRYLIGDCVKFTSTSPYKIIISGRTAHYINAFGEELMVHNAERALVEACKQTGIIVSEYTCAPIFMTEERKGAHQWAIEFESTPNEQGLLDFATILDLEVRKTNSDYDAKRTNDSTIRQLEIYPCPKGTFLKTMEAKGKVGGQNKIPRLSNNRDFIEEIIKMASIS